MISLQVGTYNWVENIVNTHTNDLEFQIEGVHIKGVDGKVLGIPHLLRLSDSSVTQSITDGKTPTSNRNPCCARHSELRTRSSTWEMSPIFRRTK